MQVNVTFKNSETNEEVKKRANEKASKIKKFIKTPIQVSFVFSKDSMDHTLELLVLGNGNNLSAFAKNNDYFSAIDECVDKILVQLKKHKDKAKNKKGRVKTSIAMQVEDLE
jgi:putative sigma-54 modulation protein